MRITNLNHSGTSQFLRTFVVQRVDQLQQQKQRSDNAKVVFLGMQVREKLPVWVINVGTIMLDGN